MKKRNDIALRLATKEQFDTLYQNMGRSISILCPSFFNTINLYNTINSSKTILNNKELWIDLLRLYYYVLFCNLDIVTVLRAELKAETVWEKRIHLKYLNVIQTEMIKAMFGFTENEHALWWKFCKDLGDTLWEQDKTEIEELFYGFKNKYFSTDSKDCRDFAIHYDKDPLKVYDSLTGLSEQVEINKVSDFLKLSEKLLSFIKLISKEQNLLVGDSKSFDRSSFREPFNVFHDNNRLLLYAKEGLAAYCSTLDRIVESYRMPETVKKIIGFEGVSSQMSSFTKTIHPSIHLLYIYIDISCALIAYLGAEYFIEKQLNLRHINVVVYEGFKKLYGFSCMKGKSSNEDSSTNHETFWKDIILPQIMSSEKNDCIKKAQEIECQLQKLANDSSINNDVLRQISVHIRKNKKVDYVPLIAEELKKMNPLQEMSKALLLLKVLPDVMELNKEVMTFAYSQQNHMRQKELDEMKNKMESVRTMIFQLTSDEAIKKNIDDSINKVLSLMSI